MGILFTPQLDVQATVLGYKHFNDFRITAEI